MNERSPGDSAETPSNSSTASDAANESSAKPKIDGLIRFGLRPMADDDRAACDKIASEVLKQPPANETTDGIHLSGTGQIPVPTDPAARYELSDEIGRGGVGEVLRGRDTTLGRKVAVKILSADHAENPQMVRRFIEEAQIGGQLQHPGIVPVHEVGYRDDGRPFFAMKLVDGSTLAELLQARSSPRDDRRRFLTIFEKVCQTIAFAHARGVVHRDLKPSNIMVGAYGEVQVMDWGLAKVLARRGPEPDRSPIELTEISTVRTRDADSHSETGSVMGTPAYMPPEQARGEVELIDERADVFALGGLLCQVLTGEPPYTGDYYDVRSLAQRGQVEGAFERIEDSIADEELKDLARDCLQPERDRRPKQAGLVADRFAAYRTGVDERAQASALAAARARSRTIAILVAGLAILAIGGILFFQERSRIDRVERTTAELIDGIEEANRALEAARAKPDDPAGWSSAEAAAKSVRKLTSLADVIESERQRGTALATRALAEVEEARAKMARATRERDMVARLGRLRALRRPLDRGHTTRAYVRAFAEFGIDLDALSVEEAAGKIRNSAIAEALLRGLDEMHTSGTPGLTLNGRPAREKLAALLIQADRSPERQSIRHAIGRRDAEALKQLAARLKPQDTSPQTFYVTAKYLANYNEFDAAIALNKRALVHYPQDYWLNRQLAQHAMVGGGDTDEAVKHLEIARALRPDHPEPRARLADLLLARGEVDLAEAETRRALALDANWPGARYQLGAVLRKKGDNEAGLAEMRKAIELNPDLPHLHYAFGQVLLAAGDPEAVTMFERVAELIPDHVPALRQVGRLRAKAGDRDAALKAFRKLIEVGLRVEQRGSDADAVHRKLGYNLKDALAHAYTFIAERHEDAKRLEQAITAYRNAWDRSIETHPIPGGQLAKILLRVGRVQEALAVGREVVKRFPTFPFGYATYGEALRQTGKYDRAIAIHRKGKEECGKIGMRYPPSLGRMAKRYADTAAWIDAREDKTRWPEDPRRLAMIALVLSERGDHGTAVSLWKKALAKRDAWKPGTFVTRLSQAAMSAGFAAKEADDTTRAAAFREQCVTWLVAAIDAMMQHATVSEATARGAVGVFETWKIHAAFVDLRPDRVDSLPEPLKTKMRDAWSRVKRYRAQRK